MATLLLLSHLLHQGYAVAHATSSLDQITLTVRRKNTPCAKLVVAERLRRLQEVQDNIQRQQEELELAMGSHSMFNVDTILTIVNQPIQPVQTWESGSFLRNESYGSWPEYSRIGSSKWNESP